MAQAAASHYELVRVCGVYRVVFNSDDHLGWGSFGRSFAQPSWMYFRGDLGGVFPPILKDRDVDATRGHYVALLNHQQGAKTGIQHRLDWYGMFWNGCRLRKRTVDTRELFHRFELGKLVSV